MQRAWENELKEKVEQLEKLEKRIAINLREAPQGTLRATFRNNVPQYYVKTDENRKTHKQGKYLRKSEWELAKKIAQRDYDEKVQSEIRKELQCLKKLQSSYKEEKLKQLYEELKPYRKQLVVPWVAPDDFYIKEWLKVSYKGKGMNDTKQEIYTEKGEKVRSKSEKIIADKLFRRGIPYRYEYPVCVKGMGEIYPDFTCLDVRNRKEILWEHMGMMGETTYCKNALRKIEIYIKAGYCPGKNIIFTFESQETPMNTKMIDALIDSTFAD